MHIACHECDLLQHVPPLPRRGKARCPRCGAVLLQHKPDSIQRTLALTVAGMVLFAVANSFPILAFEVKGDVANTTLFDAVKQLYNTGYWPIAVLVLLTTIVAPLVQLCIKLYAFLPLSLDRLPWQPAIAFRLLQRVEPWSMMGVFMLGILVSIVKLAKMATIVPGISLWAFAILILVLAWATAAMDPDVIWARLEARR
jgi:paraquat-inducible protein A